MGNSKSSSKKPSPQTHNELLQVENKEDFSHPPPFLIKNFLSGIKKQIEEETKLFQKTRTIDLMALITIMDNVILERVNESASANNSHNVWASGIGFGGGEQHLSSKSTRDRLMAENSEKESILSNCFDLFSVSCSETTTKHKNKTRRLFNRSEIRKELSEYLINDSMLDISEHAVFYWFAWKMLVALAEQPELRGCIYRSGFYFHMQKLIGVAEIYKARMEKMSSQHVAPCMTLVNEIINSKEILHKHFMEYKSLSKKRADKKAVRRAKTEAILPAAPDLIPNIEEKSEDNPILAPLREEPLVPQKRTKGKKETPTPVIVPVQEELSVEVAVPNKKKRRRKKKVVDERPEYIKALAPLVFDACSFSSHIFSNQSTSLSNIAMSRIMLEMQSLADSLPSCLTESSSIYVRTDPDNISLMKALIIGPEDTPYSLGCFEFDIQIPASYPSVPPLCKIATTDNQSFRFNPNLYANGKVCLSLIGTWAGSAEEQWDPKVSSLFQLFISIQSLILVANPYYNEPGYQFSENDAANISYNKNIQQGTTRIALLGQLRDTKNAFYDVISTHCRLKREQILQQCSDWEIDPAIVAELATELSALTTEA